MIFIHKWLGISLALLFLMWFLSGLVLYYVPFPNLTQAERRAGLQPLEQAVGCCLTAEEAARRAGVAFTEARLGMADHGAPVWRLLVDAGEQNAPQWRALDARTGAMKAPLTSVQAMKVAESFSGRRALLAEGLERDQWTVPQGLNPYRPLFKVSLEGDDGLELYVSSTAAEVVRDTRRAERFWNWIGAVPHWIYPTVLRQFPQAWNQVVVWLAIPGVLLAATGLVLGIWQLFLNRTRWIPYRKSWMRWHHIAGLVAAVFTLTWIFSGLMSMNPYGVFSSRGASASERAHWLGADGKALVSPQAALAAVASREAGAQPVELERIRVDGQVWYRLEGLERRWWVRADVASVAPAVESVLPDGLMAGALRRLRGVDRPPSDVTRMDRYDDVYYAKNPATAEAMDTRPLPVWRAHWPDGVDLYADATSGKLLLRADPSGRWQRVLYQGLHSLDFEPLRERPWLREALVLLFSLLGIALCVTSCVIGWRALAPKGAARLTSQQRLA
ncbi:PepSY-associated TM helix domain-containing protein [Variovorax sp. J22G21]|uniref:PepSY-associated TM helix domain-containing protein n=1 Tax=Variovorax fucosicus TaxID=3053517 RepID=UPI002576EDEB|nr:MULTISPECIES: PepSY-associated TM helix domain-containing protein [unclassified Variovorax]MDM0040334.1 PepSY-associated TM helix domain-containing protein [Variovorax sp. J22R193]MDM0061707.1 PepSY-associated TM helix domain-containing protein [Variovorax sp. J22G21]